MDVIDQTLLTLGCMVSAYLWGRREGTFAGRAQTWLFFSDVFNAIHIEVIEDDDEPDVIFTTIHGNRITASEIGRKAQYDEDKDQQ